MESVGDLGASSMISLLPGNGGGVSANLDISELPPGAALKMLCTHVDGLAKLTGDIPSTLLGKIVSFRNSNGAASTPITEADGRSSEREISVGIGEEVRTAQLEALARRFFSKMIPAISLEDYLLRLHRYCPMSTGVYLTTSCYITRLALTEKTVPVTPRNMHRLVLAGLRVAMKGVEDICYPHRRFAKVGGVSERELARLEINFCFLMNFELKVDAETLSHEAALLRA